MSKGGGGGGGGAELNGGGGEMDPSALCGSGIEPLLYIEN